MFSGEKKTIILNLIIIIIIIIMPDGPCRRLSLRRRLMCSGVPVCVANVLLMCC
jgi:hypothetical protein